MHLDCTKFPETHTFAQEVGEGLGLYVKVAHFTEHNGRRMFRMIVDPEINASQLRELLASTIKDRHATYCFSYLETIQGPVVDQAPTRTGQTCYIRITFQ